MFTNMLGFIGIPFYGMFIFLFSIAALVIWGWAIIDCLQSDMKTENKLIWVLVILFANIIGAVVYFLFKDKTNIKKIKGKKLYRNKKEKMVSGVCAGIGDYLEVDVTLVRVLWVLGTVLTNFIPGIIAYVIAIIIIPEKD